MPVAATKVMSAADEVVAVVAEVVVKGNVVGFSLPDTQLGVALHGNLPLLKGEVKFCPDSPGTNYRRRNKAQQ